MSRPKVSVIVPVYNAEKYLDKCLLSLCCQTLEDIEIIVCDNASTDGSRRIINMFAMLNPKIKVLFQRANLGQGNNMIAGLNAAEGDYIAECDADDIVMPAMYERLYEYAHRNRCEVAQCGWIDFTENTYNNRQLVNYDTCINHRTLSDKDKANFLGYQPHIMSCIYNLEWIQQNNLWYKPSGSYQDTSLCFRHRASAERYGIIADCLYLYRRDNTSSGTYTDINVFGVNEQYRIIERFNEDNSLGLDQIISALKYYTYRWQLGRLDGDNREAFIRQASYEFKHDTTREELFINEKDWSEYKNWRDIPLI